MDIPVLGRFFGTTTDKVDRTELIMLITPHVIRNVEEARSVTDEFKEKLSTMTREIERMRKEREKEKAQEEQKSIPQKPSPPTPERESSNPLKEGMTFYDTLAKPNGDARGISGEPLKEIKPEEKPVEPEAKETRPAFKAETVVGPEKVEEEARTEEASLPLGAEKEALVQKTPEVERVKARMGKRDGAWTVQVYASPLEREARELAKKLVDKGYEPYVSSADIKGRTWYSVRVGRLATQDEAKKLQETLKNREKYTEAFIAAEPKAIVEEETAITPQKPKGKAATEKAILDSNKEAPAQKIAEAKGLKGRTGRPDSLWKVQVGAFADERDAKSLAKKLVDKGYEPYVSSADIRGRTWYRVRVGRLATQDEAKKLQETLKNKEKYTEVFITGW